MSSRSGIFTTHGGVLPFFPKVFEKWLYFIFYGPTGQMRFSTPLRCVSIFPVHHDSSGLLQHFQLVTLPFGLWSTPQLFMWYCLSPLWDMWMTSCWGNSHHRFWQVTQSHPSRPCREVWLGPESSEVSAGTDSSIGTSFILNTRGGRRYLKFSTPRLKIFSPGIVWLCFCMKILRLMIASFEAVPFAEFHSRCLRYPVMVKHVSSVLGWINQSMKTRYLSLVWWLRNPALNLASPSFFNLLGDLHNAF